MARFQKVKCISTLDLKSGYWQIPLAKKSKDSCFLLIYGRKYSYKRVTFGLNISGSEFQKSMHHVLRPLLYDFVTIYVDDILIISETIEDHYYHIETVLKKFNEFNVTVNLEKCQFFKKEVTFLGHIISEHGIRMDPEKIETIQNFKRPSKKKEV